MQSPETSDRDHAATPAAPVRKVTTPDFSGTPVPIGQLTERPDWPQCALGVFVSIHGFEGVVVELINQSFKVVSAERITQRFNANRLKTLFTPPDRSTPVPSSEPPKRITPPVAEEAEAEPEMPVRLHITNPDFTQPMRAIRTYVSETDFPKCVYGKHVDISGYSGVVVEIVKGSLKVQSQEGTVRSYNAITLKKLYGHG